MMGWLRDLMATSDPPVPSFGRLATAALAHPSWPADTRPRQRSLATLFSKLDREQDLDWLSDRIEIQRILAELLRRPLADVQQALPTRQARAPSRLVRLDDLRYGRELDLAKEPLCPGIPQRVIEPATWGRLCWRAPSGSGRSLTGAWLEARGLATRVTWNGPPSASLSLPSRGPIFVEWADFRGPGLPDSWAALLDTQQQPICIALPEPPRASGWEVVDSPPISDVLPDLVAWVDDRLPEDGHFEPERALAWMQRVALPSEAVVTLGDALGLLGMLDEVRPRTLHGRSLIEVAESFVRQRLAESSEETTVSSWLGRNAFAALLGTIAQLLTESDRPWNHPRTFDEWLQLVPSEYRDGIDVEWMRAALSRDGTPKLRSGDLASAARKLPPGGYQLLRAFEHARIFVRHEDHLRLRPHWLGTTLEARATAELLSGSPFVWGEVLLHASHAGRIVRALFEEVRQGNFSPVHAILDLSDAQNPAYVAALEAATTTVGIAAASGVRVPSEVVSELFSEQDTLAMLLPETEPRPRIAHGSPGDDEPLLRPAAWLLGAYSLAELAGTTRTILNPFHARRPDAARALLRQHVYPALLALLHSTRSEGKRHGPPSSLSVPSVSVRIGSAHAFYPWTFTVYSLADSLRNALGPAAETPTDIELPSAMADALAKDSIQPEHLSRLSDLPFGWAALADRASARNIDASTLCRRYWQAASRLRELPEHVAPERTEDALVAELWRAAPVDWITRRVRSRLSVPWTVLLPHHYAALLRADFPLPVEVCRSAPVDAMMETVAERGIGIFDERARPALWSRSPRKMKDLFEQSLDARRMEEAFNFLSSLPDDLTHSVIASLETHVDVTTLPLSELHRLRRWLADRIARRAAHWRQVYELLNRIEETLQPLRSQIQ